MKKKELMNIEQRIQTLFSNPIHYRSVKIRIYYRKHYVLRTRAWISSNLMTTQERIQIRGMTQKLILLKQQIKNKNKTYIKRLLLLDTAKEISKQRDDMYLKYGIRVDNKKAIHNNRCEAMCIYTQAE